MIPYQKRVIDEKAELDDKLAKLNAFFPTAVFAALERHERELLLRQSTYMSMYADVLRQRIGAF